MRTLTASAQTSVDTALGAEPVILVQIAWSGGTGYYADKGLTLGSDTYSGILLNVSNLTIAAGDGISTVGSVNITVDDSDGTIRTLLNEERAEGTEVTVYLHYDGNADGDKLMLFKGKISGSTSWDEGRRTLSFSAETTIEDQKAGFSTDQSTLSDLHDDAVGKMWPLCFGSPLRVPALHAYKAIIGSTRDEETYSASGTIYVENGKDFPQSSAITIGVVIPDAFNVNFGYYHDTIIYFEGSFSGNTFTVTTKNAPKYTNVTIGSRIASDDDYDNPSVIWLDGDEQIQNQYCYIEDGTDYLVNHCYKQVGKKCWFSKPWKINFQDDTYELPTGSYTVIDEVAPDIRTSWSDTYINEWKSWNDRNAGWPITKDNWRISPGMKVFYIGSGVNSTYIANAVESSSVSEVMAYRNYNGERILAPVPSSYYTITLDQSIAGQTATVIEFETPLELRENEGWEPDLYVSLTSTKDDNTANAIKYLIDTYSDLDSDSTSFTAAETDLEDYPSHFAILEHGNVLDICRDIAWQARCGLVVRDGTVFIKYLSEAPASPDDTFTRSDVGLNSLKEGYTTVADMYTRVVAKWRQQYTDDYDEFIYENNQATFGLKELERTFWIYNIEELVQYSAAFWGYRKSNSWRKVMLQGFVSQVALEPFDVAAVNVSEFSGNTVDGTVYETDINVTDYSISFVIETSSLAGETDSAGPIEEDNYWLGDPSYELPIAAKPDNPITGRSQVDYTPEIPAENREDTSPNNPKVVVITDSPADVDRGSNFSLTVEIQDNLGNRLFDTRYVTLSLESTDGSDTLNTTQVKVEQGIYTGTTFQITGGSGADSASIIPSADGINRSVPAEVQIEPDGQPIFSDFPGLIIRGEPFDVVITGGTASATVNLSVTSDDSTGDNLHDANGDSLSSVTLDGNGDWSGQMLLDDGTDTHSEAYITLTEGAWEHSSPATDVIDISGDAPRITHTITSAANPSVGTLYYKSNGGSWSELTDVDDLSAGDSVSVVIETSGSEFKLLESGISNVDLSVDDHKDMYIDPDGAITTTKPTSTEYWYLGHVYENGYFNFNQSRVVNGARNLYETVSSGDNPSVGTLYYHDMSWTELTSYADWNSKLGIVIETSATQFTLLLYGIEALNPGVSSGKELYIDSDGSLTTSIPEYDEATSVGRQIDYTYFYFCPRQISCPAKSSSVNTAHFNGNLGPTDDSVQDALETLDDLSFSVSEVPSEHDESTLHELALRDQDYRTNIDVTGFIVLYGIEYAHIGWDHNREVCSVAKFLFDGTYPALWIIGYSKTLKVVELDRDTANESSHTHTEHDGYTTGPGTAHNHGMSSYTLCLDYPIEDAVYDPTTISSQDTWYDTGLTVTVEVDSGGSATTKYDAKLQVKIRSSSGCLYFRAEPINNALDSYGLKIITDMKYE